MRDIKFRAWFPTLKQMRSWEETYPSKGAEALGLVDKETRIVSHELMQFTGLKDKDGKEIYEGDIVEYVSKEKTGTSGNYKNSYAVYSDVKIVGEVKFGKFTKIYDNLICFYVLTDQSVTYDSYFFSDSRNKKPSKFTDNFSKPLDSKTEYTVIGTRFEHPTLLKEEKENG